jgi:hypothetical protein
VGAPKIRPNPPRRRIRLALDHREIRGFEALQLLARPWLSNTARPDLRPLSAIVEIFCLLVME